MSRKNTYSFTDSQTIAKQPAITNTHPYKTVPGSFNNTSTYKDEYISHP